MKSYLKLVHFELDRVTKVYGALIAITVISQIIGVIITSKNYLKEANHMIYNNGLSQEVFLEDYGTMSFFEITNSVWIQGPIALCIGALMFYIFLIWYRDWYGKNAFIYRMLMLPTSRLNIYFAKATTIILMVLGLVSLQILLLPIENMLFKWIVPSDFRTDMVFSEIIESFNYLTILFPSSIIDFTVHYLIGFGAVIVFFTAILLERSYGVKGFMYGIAYTMIVQIILLTPAIITMVLDKMFLYPGEYLLVQLILACIVLAGSLIISKKLLNKKITV